MRGGGSPEEKVSVGLCRSVANSIVLSFALHVALLIAAFDGLALVVFAFSFGQGQKDFYFTAFKIKPQRNQGRGRT